MNTNIRTMISLILLIFFYCLDFFFRISPSLILPELQEQFSASVLDMGGIASSFYLGYIMLQIPSGLLLDRYSYRKIIPAAIMICTLSYIGFIFCRQSWQAYNLRWLIGATSAISFISVLHYARHNFEPKWFMPITGFTISMGTIAASLIEILCAYLFQHYHWQNVFVVFSLWGVLVAIALIFTMTSNPSQAISSNKKILTQIKISFKPVFLSFNLIINGIMGGLFYLPTSLIAAMWGIPYMVGSLGLSTLSGAIGITILFSGWVIGSLLFGFLQVTFAQCQRFIGLFAIFALIACYYFSNGQLTSQISIYLSLFSMGFFSSAQVLIWQVFNLLVLNRHAGLATSYTNMLILLPAAIFHLVIGAMISINSSSKIDYQVGIKWLPLIYMTVSILAMFQYRRCSISLKSA